VINIKKAIIILLFILLLTITTTAQDQLMDDEKVERYLTNRLSVRGIDTFEVLSTELIDELRVSKVLIGSIEYTHITRESNIQKIENAK